MAETSVTKLPAGNDWIYELKLDGSPYSVAVIFYAPSKRVENR
jgi:hypothetical protein